MEKILPQRTEGLLRWRDLKPNDVGTGLCYLQSCVHKMTRDNRPYIACYLQDVDGAVIPGYVWDVTDLKQHGIEMSQATRTVVKISFEENYHPKFGMSVHIQSIGIVTNPTMEVLSTFVGSVKDLHNMYSQLSKDISDKIGRTVTLPFGMCEISSPEYSNGMLGGLVIHYSDMLRCLEVHTGKFSDDEAQRLWSTFLLYVYAHCNFIMADVQQGVDITLATDLTASIEQFIRKLKVTTGVLEVVQVFFGYEPKDIYVRIIKQVSDSLVRVNAEVNAFKSLPFTREGRTAYGVIKNYPPKENK